MLMGFFDTCPGEITEMLNYYFDKFLKLECPGIRSDLCLYLHVDRERLRLRLRF
jgi:hypothetical protein